jgi:hypothetical protein
VDGSTGVTAGDVLSPLLGQGDGGGGERLVCRACGHDVTSTSERIAMQGAHDHRKTNPAGYTFHVGCFRRAPGAPGRGPVSEEHTWFAGYAWQIAVCAGCGGQLGWLFHAEASRFHGLILERLRPRADRWWVA